MTSAFGFRNLANYDRGLAEIYRVLGAGGEVGILDFGEPKGLIGKLYRLYFRRVLPAIGTMISGVSGPYAYLPASVLRFPSPDEMLQRMRDAGFRRCVVDAVYVWDCGIVSGKKVTAKSFVNPRLASKPRTRTWGTELYTSRLLPAMRCSSLRASFVASGARTRRSRC